MAIAKDYGVTLIKSMKPPQDTRLSLAALTPLITCVLAAIALTLWVDTGLAKPRPPAPPLASLGRLHTEGFDQPLRLPASPPPDPTVWAESWIEELVCFSAAALLGRMGGSAFGRSDGCRSWPHREPSGQLLPLQTHRSPARRGYSRLPANVANAYLFGGGFLGTLH
jgi:hypothetical protein